MIAAAVAAVLPLETRDFVLRFAPVSPVVIFGLCLEGSERGEPFRVKSCCGWMKMSGQRTCVPSQVSPRYSAYMGVWRFWSAKRLVQWPTLIAGSRALESLLRLVWLCTACVPLLCASALVPSCPCAPWPGDGQREPGRTPTAVCLLRNMLRVFSVTSLRGHHPGLAYDERYCHGPFGIPVAVQLLPYQVFHPRFGGDYSRLQ